MTIRLVARQAFTFARPGGGTLRCTPGEIIEVSPIEAVLLRVRKVADFAGPPTPAVAFEAPPSPKPRNRYRRRDMTAESHEDVCRSSD